MSDKAMTLPLRSTMKPWIQPTGITRPLAQYTNAYRASDAASLGGAPLDRQHGLDKIEPSPVAE